MKHINLFFLALLCIVLGLTSCSDDGEPSGSNILNYDTENATAPTLATGFYEFTIRFTNRELSPVQGKKITAISFYLYDIPSEVNITFSPDQTISQPGEITYNENLSNLRANAWNTVTLKTPYDIDGTSFWIGIQVDLPRLMQTVGCDAGPAKSNGDWLYSDEDKDWRTFRERTSDSVNWNIRATVGD